MSDYEPREVEIIDATANAAVVRMPGRRFPGIVVQGDTLHSWSVLADSLMSSLGEAAATDPEVLLEMVELADLIRAHVDQYERILRARGLELPYPTAPYA